MYKPIAFRESAFVIVTEGVSPGFCTLKLLPSFVFVVRVSRGDRIAENMGQVVNQMVEVLQRHPGPMVKPFNPLSTQNHANPHNSHLC